VSYFRLLDNHFAEVKKITTDVAIRSKLDAAEINGHGVSNDSSTSDVSSSGLLIPVKTLNCESDEFTGSEMTFTDEINIPNPLSIRTPDRIFLINFPLIAITAIAALFKKISPGRAGATNSPVSC
jgi:hypothetical protein